MERPLDCLIIGAGPAGLTAAIYLVRFHLRVLVVGNGMSRAAMIPRTHNHAGYPEGISGPDLLARMRRQAEIYGADFENTEVIRLEQADGVFSVVSNDAAWRAQAVLLATGVTNNRPRIGSEDHDRAVARGLLRYCPICDGYEVTDKRIGVIGTGKRGLAEARFLRTYSSDITLISPDGPHRLSRNQRRELDDLGIRWVDGEYRPLRISGNAIYAASRNDELEFDTIYPALGSVINSGLAVTLGAKSNREGCLKVDKHQRTSLLGLYSAGDVTLGLDQISHAMGQAGVAATTIRNDLVELRPLVRSNPRGA